MAPGRKCSADAGKCTLHTFPDGELAVIRKNLLAWYDAHGRELPWRTVAKEEADDDRRAYAVWVSEIMCQQTQVATVIEYYKRWMAKWPSLSALAAASPDEVHAMWSGLGYYSRGRRLWEGAVAVRDRMDGKMPDTAEKLLKDLPGVGRYTAAAVASIVFGERVGVVDGNVVRVLSRMRAIGADSTSKAAASAFWELSDALVDRERPGDFNQSLMELGALVCTPKKPACVKCPVSKHCQANLRVKSGPVDIEDAASGSACSLCWPKGVKYSSEIGVMNYPRKDKKSSVRQEQRLMFVLRSQDKYLLLKRRSSGLLANFLEFPNFSHDAAVETATSVLKANLGFDVVAKDLKSLGEVEHAFSHVKRTYTLLTAEVDPTAAAICHLQEYQEDGISWLTAHQIMDTASGSSTATRKVVQLYLQSASGKNRGKRLSDVDSNSGCKRQKSITSYFSGQNSK